MCDRSFSWTDLVLSEVWTEKHGGTSFIIQNKRCLKQLDASTYRASVDLPVRSISPLRAMKVSLPQQRKIPAEK